jgi:hypothetical protein
MKHDGCVFVHGCTFSSLMAEVTTFSPEDVVPWSVASATDCMPQASSLMRQRHDWTIAS